MTRPRIAQVCAVDFTVYHFLLPLMRAQREWGFDVEAVCAPGEFTPLIEAEGFPVRPTPISRSRNPFKLARAFFALRALFRERGYAVVHVHTPVAALAGRPAARLARVPVTLYTAHGFYFHDAMRPWVRRAFVGLEKFAQRFADFLFSQSEEDLRAAVAEGIAPEGRAMAIGNGVDVSRFRPDVLDPSERAVVRAEFGAPADATLVVMMGRLVREKGYFELLDAWGRIAPSRPGARLLIIGDALPSDHDDSAAGIRRRAAELGAAGEGIVFAGLRRDVPRLLAAGDVFALPSWREGMPRSIIEAMASGLPVVATDIRGCREEVVDGETGLIVPAREAGPLAVALARLIDDAALRARMGEAGRRRALEHFSEEAVIARQEKVYRKVFEEKGITWPAPGDWKNGIASASNLPG